MSKSPVPCIYLWK